MIWIIISLGIAGILMVTEYLLCIKFKNFLVGGIIPALLFVGTVFVFASGILSFSSTQLIPFILLNSLFLGDWMTGREQFKKNQEAEINKMKAHDIATND